MPGLAPAGEFLSCYTTRKEPKKHTLLAAGCAGAFAPSAQCGGRGNSLRSDNRVRQLRIDHFPLSGSEGIRDTSCPPLSPSPLPRGEREATKRSHSTRFA